MLNKDIVNLLLDSADVSVRNEKKEGIRFLVKSGHDIELSTRIVKQFNYRWLNVKKKSLQIRDQIFLMVGGRNCVICGSKRKW